MLSPNENELSAKKLLVVNSRRHRIAIRRRRVGNSVLFIRPGTKIHGLAALRAERAKFVFRAPNRGLLAARADDCGHSFKTSKGTQRKPERDAACGHRSSTHRVKIAAVFEKPDVDRVFVGTDLGHHRVTRIDLYTRQQR